MLSVMILSVGGCMTSTTATHDCCRYFDPIYFSGEEDSPETIEQILDYLVAYDHLCGEQ